MSESIKNTGLSSAQAKTLLSKYGLNEITKAGGFTIFSSFISQFKNFLILLLLGAAIISFAVGERLDSIFIFLIVILNSAFGVYQEFKAEKALAMLKSMATSLVRVIRDGAEIEIDSRFLVPGDVIYLEEGAKIPADAKIIWSRSLEVNEAVLTGETFAVVKHEDDPDNRNIFTGTILTHGRCYALVETTGMGTKFGIIAAKLAEISEPPTPLTIKLDKFTKQIGLIGLAAAGLVFALSFIREKSILESFLFAVSLAVAIVPEGLPAVMTITLAIGMEQMAKAKAIVRKPKSIEALGSITLIATDKTGTLTTNKMSARNIYVDKKVYELSKLPKSSRAYTEVLINSILCSTATLAFAPDKTDPDIIGDTTEGALLVMAHKSGYSASDIRNKWQITDEIPFHPSAKRMSILGVFGKEKVIYTKGAPEAVLAICTKALINNKIIPLTAALKQDIEQQFYTMADNGLRVLGFSESPTEKDLHHKDHIFLGLVGLEDPVRPEIKTAVADALSAGITTMMITGDSELTARAVARKIGIFKDKSELLSGAQMDKLSDEQLSELLTRVKIFARTNPEHKLRLVKLLQAKGEIVAVTGDGVNDALALKQADVGVSMGITGTDVAKETADIILTDDNFATLVNAVRLGRNITHHIKTAVKFLLACNTSELIYLVTAAIFNFPLLIPLQILYINLVTDGLPALSIAFAPEVGDIMKQKPNALNELLSKRDYIYILIFGLSATLIAMLAALPFLGHINPRIATTILFIVMISTQQYILIDVFLSHRPVFKHFRKLKQPIFIIAFLMPFALYPVILNVPLFVEAFKTVMLPINWLIYALLLPWLIFIPVIIYNRINSRVS